MKKVLFFLFLTACCNNVKNINTTTKNTVIDQESFCENVARKDIKADVYYPLGIIGEVEPVYLKDIDSVFYARIDTGAETSSIDAFNIREFERDGEPWVSFDVKNRETKEKMTFEKKIVRKTFIKRQQGEDEKRIVVDMEIKIGNQLFIKEFSLGNRKKFNYQVLIGRNILNGLAVVDVAIKNSLK